MSKFLCWLNFHDWICLSRYRNHQSEMTNWVCSRCGKQRFEQWDDA